MSAMSRTLSVEKLAVGLDVITCHPRHVEALDGLPPALLSRDVTDLPDRAYRLVDRVDDETGPTIVNPKASYQRMGRT